MYSVCKLKKHNIPGLLKVSNILYQCGKDMAEKQHLQHWNNSHIKNWAIVALCALKNNIYLVYDEKTPVATFQTKKIDQSYLFQKLATLPEFTGKGTGTFCLNEIEKMGKENGCKEVICEVYDQSEHAISFYKHRGYEISGATETLKYREWKMRKEL